MSDINELINQRDESLAKLGYAIASARVLALDVYNNEVTPDQIKAKTDWLCECAVAVLNINQQIDAEMAKEQGQ